MRGWIAALTMVLLAAAAPALALTSGDDILVPAAGRGAPWVTDLYIMNPGSQTVALTVSWLVRNQANPNPTSRAYSLAPNQTLILDDVIFNDFGLATGDGAFRIQASGAVIANCRIYATGGGATFGQGFEGVQVWELTQTGQSSDVVGLTQGFGFRTNVYAIGGPTGATIDFTLRNPAGGTLATTSLTLGVYQPYLRRVNQLFAGLADFADGTLHVAVTAGTAVAGASKVDNASTDPTTLEPALAGSGGIDGTYQFAIYDSQGFATGGNLVVEDGLVTAIYGTYSNYDKLSGSNPACPLVFQWGEGLINLGPTPVEEFADGVVFEDSYASAGSGDIEWTVEFEIEGNASLVGTVDAEGSNFSGDESGCNGSFPALNMLGGKSD